MIQRLHIWGVLCLIFIISNATPCVFAQKGSVIVIQTKGVVEAYSPQGRKLTAPVVRGSVLPVGYSIKTGLFAESILLLSNGTTAILQENSKLRLDKFEQAPFDAKAGSFSQLQAEPSTSQVSIDMEIGSLVVQTKKLNKASSFSISTPVGTAGIRGTQFQMAMSPNSGMKLDVAESQVAFTPAGQAQPVVVGPGKGLDASPNGVVKQRPISPSAAQNINVKNSAANSVCGTVPVATAKQANAKAETSNPGNNNGEGSTEDSEDAESNENDSGKESDSEQASEAFIDQSANAIRTISGPENSDIYKELVLKLLSGEDSIPEVYDMGEVEETGPVSPPPSFNPGAPVGDFKLSFSDNNNDNDNDLELIVLDFWGVPIPTPPTLLTGKESTELEIILKEWISGKEEDYYYDASLALESFLKHASRTKYNTEDKVNNSFRMAWFITSLFFHDLIGDHAIKGQNVVLYEANWDQILQGNFTPGAVLNAKHLIDEYGTSPYLYDLGVSLINEGALGTAVSSGNNIALNLLNQFSPSSGVDLPDAFSLGTLQDKEYLFNSVLLGASHNDLLDAEDSPEKQAELDKLYKIYPENLNGVVGSDIHIGDASSSTNINVGKWLKKATIFESDSAATGPSNDKKVFTFAAGKDLHLAGDVTFQNSVNGVTNKTEDHALVLGSAQETNIGHIEGEGPLPSTAGNPYPTSITFEGSNLGIGSYENLTLTNVEIDVGGNLALGTLSNLTISKADLRVGRNSDPDNVYMFAEELLEAHDLSFSGRTREIYMEANTIDLRDVRFPANSEVMLRSKDGAPHFYGTGTSNPNSSYKPYQVNFYSSSNSYGGTPIVEGEFLEKSHGVKGWNSTTLKTNSGDAAIKIRAFPE